MQFEIFQQSTKEQAPSKELSVYLQAMWYDAHGDWHKAHHLVDSLENTTACWVHAYLHRKEGDLWNADYWYHKAGKIRPAVSLAEEWEMIVKALL